MNPNSEQITERRTSKYKDAQRMKIQHLKDEIEFVKEKMKASTNKRLSEQPITKNLKTEIINLELKILNQSSQLMRLEDKYEMLEKALKSANEILEKSHTDVMDAEEMNYITESIENKKNELMSSRNFINEIQKIGYSRMPVKVADECQKTSIELEYINKTTLKYKREADELIAELKEKTKELKKVQKQFNDKKQNNNTVEFELQEIANESDVLTQAVLSKDRQVEELQEAVKDYELELNEAIEKNKEKAQMKTKEEQEEKELRNKELNDLNSVTNKLQKTLNKKEKKLKTLRKSLKNVKNVLTENAKYNIGDLRNHYAILETDIETLKESIVAEIKLKLQYFAILEDMLGRMRIMCRIRGGTPDNILKIDVDSTFSLAKNAQKIFEFDYFFNTDATNAHVFSNIEYLYNMAFEGFNCYIVTMGGKQSGKSYTTIGDKQDGLVWLGLKKINERIAAYKKDQMRTRMFVCSVEIHDDVIFDLIAGDINQNIEIRKDCFNMILLCQAKYIECFEVDEVRKTLEIALRNRSKISSKLNSTDTTFVFLVTFQIFNKFQHRYFKGKVTHVKLASFEKLNVLNSELHNLANGSSINYRRNKHTELLRDCFGGSGKTCVIGSINPSSKHEKETVGTLNLISKLKTVLNEINKNSEPEEIYRLKNDIERLLRGVKCETL